MKPSILILMLLWSLPPHIRAAERLEGLDWEPQHLTTLKETYRKAHEKRDGHYVESFRFATEFYQK